MGIEPSSHEPEKDFAERVVDYLEEQYGVDNVEQNKYLPDPYRFADVWVSGPLANFAIEIENDFEAVLKGVGQVLIYAAEEVNAVPVIIVPPDHVDEPEVSSIRRRVPVIELDV